MIQFVQLSMLIWAAVSIVPWLLLRRRMRPKYRLMWSANRFFEPALVQQQRSFNLKQWLLLLVRCLALLCIGIAVADPLWISSSVASLRTNRNKLVCYVIDCSPSMALRRSSEDRKTLLDLAIEDCLLHAGTLRKHDMVAVFSASQRIDYRYIGDAEKTLDLQRSLSQLEVRHTSVALDAIAPVIQGVIEDAKKRFPSLVEIEVRIISDFTLNEWSLTAVSDLVKGMDAIPITRCSFESVREQISSSAIQNLTIQELEMKSPEIIDDPILVSTSVQNTGRTEIVAAKIALTIGGRELESKSVSIAAGDLQTLQWSVEPSFMSDRPIVVEIVTQDQLDLDNLRYIVLPRSNRRKINLVSLALQQAIPLSLAMESLKLPSTINNYFESKNLSIDSITHVIDPAIENIDAAQLLRSLSSGANIVIWMGPALDAFQWQEKYSTDAQSGIFPSSTIQVQTWESEELANISIPSDSQGKVAISAVDISMPMRKHWRFGALEQDWGIVLNLPNGEGFAVRRRFDSGTLTWITSPPTLITTVDDQLEAWNAFAIWPNFLPLVNIVNRIAAVGPQQTFMVGETLGNNLMLDTEATIVDPVGRNLPLSNRSTSTSVSVALPTELPGFYTIRSNDKATPNDEHKIVAVNLNASEFVLECLSSAEISKLVSGDLMQTNLPPDNFNLNSNAKPQLFRYFLMLAIVLLCFELIFSTWLVIASTSSASMHALK